MSEGMFLGKYPLDMTVEGFRKQFFEDYPTPTDFVNQAIVELKFIDNKPIIQASQEARKDGLPGIIGDAVFDVIMGVLLEYQHKSDDTKRYKNMRWGNPKANSWEQNIGTHTIGNNNVRAQYEAASYIMEFGLSGDNLKQMNLEQVYDRICDTYQKKITQGEWKDKIQTIQKVKKIFHISSSHTTQKTEEKPMPKDPKEEIKDLIKNRQYQIIMTGAPGTGKTYAAKKIAEEMAGEYELVQFHPSYDYTDFVEGLRPVQIDGAVTFKKMDGIFKKFCRAVVEHEKKGEEEKLFFFIIDEINRADLSKVFGELMYGLEKDKRGEKNRFKTQYANLPTYDIETKQELSPENDCFHEGFYIPEHVVIIGTMNDIDRSVESFDFALRRRFSWYEVKVERDLLTTALKEMQLPSAEGVAEQILKLNEVIHGKGERLGLNSHYDISQGHFTNLPEQKTTVKDICEYVWTYRISNILEEYVRGEEQTSVESFMEACKNSFLNNLQGDQE